jgi:hypothetical protein
MPEPYVLLSSPPSISFGHRNVLALSTVMVYLCKLLSYHKTIITHSPVYIDIAGLLFQ